MLIIQYFEWTCEIVSLIPLDRRNITVLVVKLDFLEFLGKLENSNLPPQHRINWLSKNLLNLILNQLK